MTPSSLARTFGSVTRAFFRNISPMLLLSCCTVTSSCKLYCFTTYGISRQTFSAGTDVKTVTVSSIDRA